MKREVFNGEVALAYALFTILAIIGLIGTALMAGCGATAARKVVIGGYTAIGATSVIGRASLKQCEEKAIADRSDAEMAKCATGQAVLSKALPIAQDAAATATDTIAAYEKINAKDYGGALAPLYDALGNLAQALSIAGIKGHEQDGAALPRKRASRVSEPPA